MQYWLLKTEPYEFSFSMLLQQGKTSWDGVRNYQACNNLKAMQIGDKALIYHSVHERQIVGIAEVIKEHYPDPTDETGRFVMVDIAPVAACKNTLSLAQIKAHPLLQNMAMVRQGRLSVSPVTQEEWDVVGQF
jgi:predicted RNA-binding protein with PUA-like domain